jgi:asparagine N-glycosylation enzyme membrane subunit Stt3
MLKMVSALAKKWFLIIAVVAIAVIVATVFYSLYPSPISVDKIGGKYNATVTHWTDRVQLTYTDETGEHTSSYFDDNLKTGLNWISTQTPETTTIFAWWDYGHMITAAGQRSVVARNPSQEILTSISDPSSIKEFDFNDKIVDIAQAFITDDPSILIEIMGKYDADYVMVCSGDEVKAAWMCKTVGLNSSEYVSSDGPMMNFTDLGKTTMLAKLLDNKDTGLTLVYQDAQMKIYKLSGV